MPITHSDSTVTHVGLVLGNGGERWNDSMHIMSYYAMVWNPETQKSESIYSHDDFYVPESRIRGHYEVDATPEVVDAYRAYTERLVVEQRAFNALCDSQRVEKGKVVQVIRGRKVAHGTRGLVFWYGNNGYGESVGLRDVKGETYFTALTNVVVAGHYETVVPSQEEMAALEARMTESREKWASENGYQKFATSKRYTPNNSRNRRRYAY